MLSFGIFKAMGGSGSIQFPLLLTCLAGWWGSHLYPLWLLKLHTTNTLAMVDQLPFQAQVVKQAKHRDTNNAGSIFHDWGIQLRRPKTTNLVAYFLINH
mmetsp:Transcript_32634/g.96178  ORF Transcript_32634/g.96178 Transcript_32634/m.96178 type:complete len:99 (-) Transcript_32634:87-383(-)